MAQQRPSRRCRVCGTEPKVGVMALRNGQGAHYVYCPRCWTHGPLASERWRAVSAWDVLMGGDKDAD